MSQVYAVIGWPSQSRSISRSKRCTTFCRGVGSEPPASKTSDRDGRNPLAQLPVGEAVRQQPEARQGCQQVLDAAVPEAQRRRPLSHDPCRRLELLEALGSQRAVVAEAFDAHQASVGFEADLFQMLELAQPTPDSEVVAVVDGGLGAQRAPFFEILMRVLL